MTKQLLKFANLAPQVAQAVGLFRATTKSLSPCQGRCHARGEG